MIFRGFKPSPFLSDYWNLQAIRDVQEIDKSMGDILSRKVAQQRSNGSFWQWIDWVEDYMIRNPANQEITNPHIAERCGLTDTAVSHWFNRANNTGKNEPPGEDVLPKRKNKPSAENVVALATYDPAFTRFLDKAKDLEASGLRYAITWLRACALGDEQCKSVLEVDEFEFLFQALQLDHDDANDIYSSMPKELKDEYPTRKSDWLARVMADWGKAYRIVFGEIDVRL